MQFTDIDEAGLRRSQTVFDQAFAAPDPERLGSLFSEDAEIMFDRMEVIVGREAITETFRIAFESSDFRNWSTDYPIVEVFADHALVIGDYDMEVHPYDTRPAVRLAGRAMWFWRRLSDGVWRLAYVMDGRRGETRSVDA